MKRIALLLLVGFILILGGCAPKVGSEAWCKAMKDKPKGDWTVNEAADYGKYCVLKMKNDKGD